MDWIHWGLNGNTAVVRKAGANLIRGELKKSGEGYRDATPGFGMSVKWSDGEPVRAVSDTHASLWWNGVGHGYTIEAPAGSNRVRPPRLCRRHRGRAGQADGPPVRCQRPGFRVDDLERQPCVRLVAGSGRFHRGLHPALSSRLAGPDAPGHLGARGRAQSLSGSSPTPGRHARPGKVSRLVPCVRPPIERSRGGSKAQQKAGGSFVRRVSSAPTRDGYRIDR